MQLNKPIFIVYNPKGGSASEAVLKRLIYALQMLCGAAVQTLATKRDANETRADIQKLIPDTSLFIAMGGDGTARVVAESIGNLVPMAVFPGGTGNLFARTFYNYPDPATFAEMIAHGHTQPIDLMEAEYTPEGSHIPEKRLVMVALGIGKLSDAIADADPTWKRWLGTAAYAIGMTRASFEADDNRVSFTNTDGTSLGKRFEATPVSAAFLLNVAPPQVINISRGCNASDGLLDLVLLRAERIPELVTTAFWLGIGKPERSSHYARRRLRDVVVTSRRPMKLNLDGDSGGLTTAVTVRTLPGAVQMVLA